MTAHNLTIEQTPIGDLRPHPRNARNGDTDVIADSLTVNGQYKPIVLAADGTILAGNHTYMAAMELGWDTIATVRLDVAPESPEALRIMLADNRTADLGRYDDGLLLDLLRDLDRIDGTGYTADDLDHLKHVQEDFFDDKPNNARPAFRTSTIDLIWSAADPYTSLIAHLLGWGQGFISTSLPRAAETLLEMTARMRNPPTVDFIDNEWHGYDHAKHMAAVERWKPKYATVRDAMTKTQCDEAGVEYFTVDQIITQAEDAAAAGAANVIIIPKFDCLADLPDTIGSARVVLGYSVPSSYGRTNLDPQLFDGRPVHLLGGSWQTQRSLCAALGESVVSLDNNYMLKAAKFGTIVSIDGTPTATVDDLLGHRVAPGGFLLNVALSLGIAHADAASWNAATTDTVETITADEGADER